MLDLFDQDALLHRLSDAIRKRSQEVIFLLGAGLSMPTSSGSPGVLDADGVVGLIREEFDDDQAQLAEFIKATRGAGNRKYQAAFLFLQARRGQSAANEIVRRAVLGARAIFPGYVSASSGLEGGTDEDWRMLELDSRWALNPGTESIGKLIVHYPVRFGKSLLTTNFDPLLEVSLRKAGGQFFRTMLDTDGDLSQTEGPGCHVIHLHGYWYGSDTLHTSRQLLQSRPRLKASLARLLRDKLLVVCGYGGWDDVFMSALAELVADDSATPEILWGFRSQTPSIDTSLADRLSPGLNRGRVSLYAGVDCNLFFPALYEKWLNLEQPVPFPVAVPTNSVRVKQPLLEQLQRGGTEQRILEGDDEDRPPRFEFFVGRDVELRLIGESKARVVFLTGIGGQGKSTVAARYFSDSQSSGTYSYFVWRDCKEESERFENQLASVVETLSKGAISGEDLAKQTTESMIQLVLNLTKDIDVLFVFDNVDHYVDLERNRMTASADQLIRAFLSAETRSRIILTCRPSVNYHDPLALSCHLEGISLSATRQLLLNRGAAFSDAEAEEAHLLTDGHAFWLDLLSIQVAKTPSLRLGSLIEKIQTGGGSLPERNSAFDLDNVEGSRTAGSEIYGRNRATRNRKRDSGIPEQQGPLSQVGQGLKSA